MTNTNKKRLTECRKQHIVPRFLQVGFPEEDNFFRHTPSNSFPVSLNDNYAERDYYSEIPEEEELKDKTLDKKITRAESDKFVPTLRRLLELNMQKEFPVDQEISEFVYHFLLRNKTIIQSIMDVIHEGINNLTSLRKSSVDKTIDSFWLRNLKEFSLNKHIISKSKIKENYPTHIFYMTQEVFLQERESFLRGMHEKCLDSNTYLTSFTFQIIEGFFVLPDTVLTCYNSKLEQKYLPIIDQNTEHVLFPISKGKMLVIYKDDFPKLEMSEINKYLVSSAQSFSSGLPQTDNLVIELKKNIGETSFSLELSDELEKLNQGYVLQSVISLEKKVLPILRKSPLWETPPIPNSNKNKNKKRKK